MAVQDDQDESFSVKWCALLPGFMYNSGASTHQRHNVMTMAAIYLNAE